MARKRRQTRLFRGGRSRFQGVSGGFGFFRFGLWVKGLGPAAVC